METILKVWVDCYFKISISHLFLHNADWHSTCITLIGEMSVTKIDVHQGSYYVETDYVNKANLKILALMITLYI